MYGNVALTKLDIVVPDLLIFMPDHWNWKETIPHIILYWINIWIWGLTLVNLLTLSAKLIQLSHISIPCYDFGVYHKLEKFKIDIYSHLTVFENNHREFQ